MSEKHVEHACDDLVTQLGGEVVRFSQARATNQTHGISDRRYRVFGCAFWFEVKTATGKLYRDQYDFLVAELRKGEAVAVGGVTELREFLGILRRSCARARIVGEQQLLERRALGLKPRQTKKKRQPMAGTRGAYEALVRAQPDRFPHAAQFLGHARRVDPPLDGGNISAIFPCTGQGNPARPDWRPTMTRTHTTTSLTLPDLDALRTERAPLYHHYPAQSQPQDAYIALDTETGEVTVESNPEIGNGVPARVWHGIVRRYEIPAAITGAALADLVGDLIPLLARVYEGAETVWDGHNHVARLDADAQGAHAEIERRTGRQIDTDDYPQAAVWDAADWIAGGDTAEQACQALEITRDTTDARIREIAYELEQGAEADCVVLDGDVYRVLIRWRDQLDPVTL